jgi:chromosome segregation ATPase
MSKITEQDRQTMLRHLREMNKLSIKVNHNYSKDINKHISHSIELTQFIKEDRAQIQRLNNVIDIKQREIDELNERNTNLLWDLAKLEKRCSDLEKRIITDDIKRAQVQKKISKEFNLESVDN